MKIIIERSLPADFLEINSTGGTPTELIAVLTTALVVTARRLVPANTPKELIAFMLAQSIALALEGDGVTITNIPPIPSGGALKAPAARRAA